MNMTILLKNNICKLLFILLILLPISMYAQEQSRESAAVDPTAAQWSFQLAYENFMDYKETDIRGEGNKGFVQFRLVAPIPKGALPLTLLPRLTMRYVNNAAGDWGFGQSDIFVLGILQQWASGRWGLGPQINFPSQEGFGNKNMGYGLAAAITQRAMDDDLFLALLLQQTWAKNDALNETKASALGINIVIVYQLGNGFYVGNGDYVIKYDWDSGNFFVPFGIRFGRAFINPKGTWNAYIEYASSLLYDEFPGPIAGQSIRVNVQYQIPVSL